MLAALAGLAVGLAYAAIIVYWAVGGRWLLNTVGISLSQPGQAGHLATLLAVWGAAAVKVVAAVLPLLAIGVWPRTANGGLRRLARVLTWIEAAILTGYGLVLTASGLLVQAGVIEAVAHADRLALKWHAYLWDPWFLIWGLFVFLALWRSRPASQDHLPGRTPGAVQGATPRRRLSQQDERTAQTIDLQKSRGGCSFPLPGFRPYRGSARGSPKWGKALLSENQVMALIWSPRRVRTIIP
jgi:Protein of unknown function (DUF3995)